MDERGDTVRTFTHKPKDGLNRIGWNMRRDGVSYPSRRDPRPDSDKPSGRSVLPGAYKIVGVWGTYKDSIMVNVNADPRIEVTGQMLASKDEALAAYEDLITTAYEGFEQLKNAKKSVGIVNAASVNLPDSTQKNIKDAGKKVTKRIDELMKLYMQPEGLKGIQRAPNNLTGLLGRASSYLNRSIGPSGDNGTYAVANARRELESVISEVNGFVENEWKEYREMVENTEFELLKEVEIVD